VSQPAHTELGEQQSGAVATWRGNAGVDDTRPILERRGRQAQFLRSRDRLISAHPRALVHLQQSHV
jgi:hypothetical protein